MPDLVTALAVGACVALAGRAGSLVRVGADLPAASAGAAARRSARLRSAVLEALQVIGETLRSGGSLDLAFVAVGRDAPAPVGPAFRVLHGRLSMGMPFDDALARWEREVRGEEAHLLAATLRMHHRAGGSLASVLANLASAIRDRLEVAAEIRALTSQARLSAWVVGSLPVGFLCFLSLISGPGFLGVFVTPAGLVLLLVGSALQIAAAVWIRRILALGA